MDIGPIVNGHVLVIPKSHCANVTDAPPEVLADLMKRIPAIAKATLAATGADAFHLLSNSGSNAQQSVMHLHFHIIPRMPGDGFHVPWQPRKLGRPDAVKLC